MLSRVAENLFWMARYMERTSMQLRLLRTSYLASQDGVPFIKWEDLYKNFNTNAGQICDGSYVQILNCILFDMNNDFSIANNIFKARENARSAQDHITKEVWQSLNDFYHLILDSKLQNELLHGDPISVFDTLVNACMIYYGVVQISMFRGDGFSFLRIGECMERAFHVSQLLKGQLLTRVGVSGQGEELLGWRYFIMALEGYELYLKNHPGYLEPESLVEQVLNDAHFPNSVMFCLAEIKFYAKDLASNTPKDVVDKFDYEIGKAYSILKYEYPAMDNGSICDFLQKIETQLYNIGQLLNEKLFAVTY